MRKIEYLLITYGESHQNSMNKLIHWLCIPAILFSLVGLLMQFPIPLLKPVSLWINWGTIVMILASIYYFLVSPQLAIGFILVFSAMIWGNLRVDNLCKSNNMDTRLILLIIFVISWIGQFIGHYIEGKKPSFFQDLQYLLVGPVWLLSFVYKKIGLKY
ncbi:MAG: DUF962 domain-containing protein [Saprospiraceae bacterium]|nr:DUF962 domain-containing protein [Saprospiraceae bacterium]